MLKRGIVAVACAAAFSGVVLAVTASGSSTPSHASAVSLHLIEHPVFEHVVDVAPKGDSQGDLFPFSNPLFNASDTQQVGGDQGNCIRTNPRRGEWQCSWTNKLPNGQITVAGPFYDTATTASSPSSAEPAPIATRTARCCSRCARTASTSFFRSNDAV